LKYQGHTCGDTSQDTACIIGFCDDFSVLYGKFIVIFTASEIASGKSGAEINALYGRNAIDGLGNFTLHPTKKRAAKSCR
jgi:hypothetical protein